MRVFFDGKRLSILRYRRHLKIWLFLPVISFAAESALVHTQQNLSRKRYYANVIAVDYEGHSVPGFNSKGSANIFRYRCLSFCHYFCVIREYCRCHINHLLIKKAGKYGSREFPACITFDLIRKIQDYRSFSAFGRVAAKNWRRDTPSLLFFFFFFVYTCLTEAEKQ